MISVTVGYPYVEFNERDNRLVKLNNFFNAIEPDKEKQHRLLTSFAECLDGSDDKNTMINIGENCGKSTMMRLLRKTFGQYFREMPSMILKDLKYVDINHPICGFAACEKARIVVVSAEEDVCSINRVADITNHKKILTYSKQFKLVINMQTRTTIQSDTIPDNIEVFEYVGNFVKDPDMQYKIENLHQAFIWLLINKYYNKK